LTAQQAETFIPIIDEILGRADLQTISVKRTIANMQERLGYDITDLKPQLKLLIGERFDVISSQPAPKDEEADEDTKPQSVETTPPLPSASPSPAPDTPATTNGVNAKKNKRRSSSSDSSDLSSPPPAKKPKTASKGPGKTKTLEEQDAEFAAQLQAQENLGGRARSTRGARGHANSVTKKKGTPAKKVKRKSKATLNSDDDSDIEGGEKKEEKKKKGGFHKPLILGPALAAFIGEAMASCSLL
jgi:upstream activation factor subunit UAF30